MIPREDHARETQADALGAIHDLHTQRAADAFYT
jgi:hypothetical protein